MLLPHLSYSSSVQLMKNMTKFQLEITSVHHPCTKEDFFEIRKPELIEMVFLTEKKMSGKKKTDAREGCC